MTWPDSETDPEAGVNLALMVPSHLHDGISRHVEHGVSTGDFLTAVFEGDLYRAAQHADGLNAPRLTEIAKFLIWHAPSASIGSPAKVEAWRKHGGLGHTPSEVSTPAVDEGA